MHSSIFQECLEFLKQIELGGSVDLSAKSSDNSGGLLNLYLEAAPTFFKVLLQESMIIGLSM